LVVLDADNESAPVCPVDAVQETDQVAVAATGHFPTPFVRSCRERYLNMYPHGGGSLKSAFAEGATPVP